MNVEDYDPTVPFYAIADEDYQSDIPAGQIVVVREIRIGDFDDEVAWEMRDRVGRLAIVPSGSLAELFLRTGKVARPGTQG